MEDGESNGEDDKGIKEHCNIFQHYKRTKVIRPIAAKDNLAGI